MVTLDTHRIILIAGLLSCVSSPLYNAEASDPLQRIRLLHPCLPTLIADAAARSPTVRDLVARLNRSDVIVFVRCAALRNSSTAGRLVFLGAAGAHRFLLIEIRIPALWHTQASVAAHELQHAIEIAEAPAVRDQVTMAQYYGRAGHRTGQNRVFDTEAARRTGFQASRELRVVPDGESARMPAPRGEHDPQR